MSWKEDLRERDKTDNYVVKDLLPELTKAAVEHGSSTALQLLGTTMLVSCVKYQDKVHPLGTLFEPETVFRKVFLSIRAIENDGFWSEPNKMRLLRTVPELLLNNPQHLLQITGVVSGREKCSCGRHGNERSVPSSSNELCDIPVVLLWEEIAKLSAECRRRAPFHQRDEIVRLDGLIVRLDGLIELLRPDSGLTEDDWWPVEDKPLPVWSRYRALFMLSVARSMLCTVKELPSNGLSNEGGPAPISKADLDAAELKMQRFWEANNKKYNYKLRPPTRADLGDSNSRFDELVEHVSRARYNRDNVKVGDKGKWPICRDTFDDWLAKESAAFSILERIVFAAVVEAHNFVIGS